MGGLTTMTSLYGRFALNDALLKSPCRSMRLSSIALELRNGEKHILGPELSAVIFIEVVFGVP